MNFYQTLIRSAFHQVRNLRNLVCGYPLKLVSLGNMTLDRDDVALAGDSYGNVGKNVSTC